MRARPTGAITAEAGRGACSSIGRLCSGGLSRGPFLYLVTREWILYLGGVKKRTDRSRMGGRRGRAAHFHEWEGIVKRVRI